MLPRLVFFYSMLMLFICTGATGQTNLNIYNGLPSNHVYMTLTDRNGYLWMATTNGVVKYNGYSLKVFNTASGLSRNDVYNIYLDRQNRIWVLSLSNTIGYIKNDRYYPVWVTGGYFYPNGIAESDTEIVVLNRMHAAGVGYKLVMSDAGDVLRTRQTGPKLAEEAHPLRFVEVRGDAVTVQRLDADAFRKEYDCICPDSFSLWRHGLPPILFGSHLFYLAGGAISHVDLKQCRCDWFPPGDKTEKAFYLHTTVLEDGGSQQFLYVIHRDSIRKFDRSLRKLETYSISRLTGGKVEGNDVFYFSDLSFWGRVASSRSAGVFLHDSEDSAFRRVAGLDLSGYAFVGAVGDSVGFWWNPVLKQLAEVRAEGRLTLRRQPFASDVVAVIPYDKQKSFLIADQLYWLDHETGKAGAAGEFSGPVATRGTGLRHVVPAGPAGFQMLFSRDVRLISLHPVKRSIPLVLGRYNDLLFDSTTGMYCLYNENSIVCYRDTGAFISFDREDLAALGLGSIKKILVNPGNGDIFIRDHEQLVVFSRGKIRSRRLFPEIVFGDAKLLMKDNWLVLAGRFGVLFCALSGEGNLGEPVVYHNNKNQRFTVIEGVQLLPSGVLLNTDGGLWQIPFPSPGSVPFSGSLPFRMVLQYGDTTRQVRSGDTVRLGQDHLRMLIDIIRPAGNGALKYQYRMAEGPGHWRDLNANELVFGKLPAGRPLALFLRAHDDVWRSGTLTFTLFAIPYWWQTAPWVQLIWLAAAFGAALIISFIIWLTRKRIERNVGKRNQLLELELKAIYAQLNPHFVFNTLNGALYLIRKQQAEEAYLHISRFSSLLRAYLKSSRNRFITLSEEISNMENYLLLQQTRFAHIFTYEIKTTGITIPDRIHIPSLILQPIVENAINHGLQQKQNKGHIKIAFELDPETKALICTVEDNGIGRKKAREAAGQKVNEKESYGNELISELINLFNRYERMGISLYYTDKQDPESGTVVTIVIKRPRYEYHR